MKRGHGMIKKLLAVWALAFAAAMPLMADTWTDPNTGYTWTYRINGDAERLQGADNRRTAVTNEGRLCVCWLVDGRR